MYSKKHLKLRVMGNVKKVFFVIISLIVFSGCVPKNDKLQIIKNTSSIQNKQNDCNKYIKKMNYAFSYVLDEFEKGYFFEKDIIGAKAQLFLIENKSKSLFAQNINNAEHSYFTQYQLAQKKRCNLKKFGISPLETIRKRINKLSGSK